MEKNLRYRRDTKSQTRRLLGIVNDLYGKQPVSEFGIAALKNLRQRFVDQGLCRSTVNSYIGTICRVFDWGREEEIIPAEVYGALRAVRSLKQGRTSAPDYDPVKSVAEAIVEKTLAYLKPIVQDMARNPTAYRR
jgi:hypothetical protein